MRAEQTTISEARTRSSSLLFHLDTFNLSGEPLPSVLFVDRPELGVYPYAAVLLVNNDEPRRS